MATYYHGASEMQPEGLQTLYLMNPSYISYADATAATNPSNMVLLSSTINSPITSMNLQPSANHQQPQQQQHFVGVPLHEPGRPQPIHDVSSAVHGLVPPRLHYNLWTPPPPQPQQGNSSTQVEMLTRHLGLGRRETAMSSGQQGLSLTLSPHELVAPEIIQTVGAGEMKVMGSSDGGAALQSFLMGSKYLKAAQELLDEVVNVGKGIKGEGVKVESNVQNKMKNSSNKGSEGTEAAVDEESSGKRSAAELTTVERQELQMKKAKLVNMLDEVEQRYRQYHHQMQIVVSSFEAIAGPGSAKTYTALALQTISKQFRCLRDAITGQIRLASKSLGEEDTKTVGSRLRFVDQHLRQQRALQQLGIIQHNAWRPQRGLPERSVSILRAWLFEHFLHPYPKDSDKLMLAKQTGLTRSQVSNWFINARVRLWKPMVEEMYLEEVKEQEQNNDDENSNKSDDNGSPTTKSNVQQESSQATEGPNDNLNNDQWQASASVQASYLSNDQNQPSYYDNETMLQPSLKRARSNESVKANVMPHSMSLDMKPEEASNQELLMKFIDARQGVGDQGYSLISQGATNHGGNSYGSYTIGDLGRYNVEQFAPRYSSNGVSLTLGLQHCDNLSLSGAQQSFLSNDSMQPLARRLDMSSENNDFCSLNNNANVAHSSSAYESINMQNRKSFAAQLLPDYVA